MRYNNNNNMFCCCNSHNNNNNNNRRYWFLVLLNFLLLIQITNAVLPKLALNIQYNNNNDDNDEVLLLSHALFGKQPGMNINEQQSLNVHVINNDDLLCDNVTTPSTTYTNTMVFIPRGECTFETKVYNAQLLGADAAIIYGTLASRYSLNKTNHNEEDNDEYTVDDIIFPQDKYDYDCNYGLAYIPKNEISLNNPYPYNPNNKLEGDDDDNLCIKYGDTNFINKCKSKSCLLTGEYNSDNNKMEACCAWDLSIWLYPDTSNTNPPNITIPAAYMTMEQIHLITQNINNINTVTLYERWRPTINISAILIWLLGTIVAAIASYVSAGDYHHRINKILKRRQQQSNNNRSPNNNQQQRNQQQQPIRHQESSQDDILELTTAHAAGFVFMASTSLLVLFYFKIYGIVKIFYAIGCSTAVAQVIIYPIYTKIIIKNLGYRDMIVYTHEEIGDVTIRDIITHGIGFTLGLIWLLISYIYYNAETITFFWMMQDIFGACMCITFLKVIRLNSIRVAAILLIVAFFYDIFFVFITPYIFHGKSVMITVATSGGPPKADALWCEKYPTDNDCKGGNPLPMLLAIPKLFDFTGGSSLLGLGDIVLPGLLLSFAARLDAAKALLGIMGGGRGTNNQSYNCPEQQFCSRFSPTIVCRGGYYSPLIIAYAIGLGMANTAVYVMNMGQPALLYLVPACLGTMIYIGWRRMELDQLWDGPRVLKAADDIIFGHSSCTSPSAQNNHAPLPTDDFDENGVNNCEDALSPTQPPSSSMDTEGDLPLMNNKI